MGARRVDGAGPGRHIAGMAHAVRFVVPETDDGMRLDLALARHVPGLSRRRARAS